VTVARSDTGTVRAVVVIRTSPPGFHAPYALAVVATEGRPSLRRIDSPLSDHPKPGDRVTLIGSDVALPIPSGKP
jgi:uncharacterized OB-fold protein